MLHVCIPITSVTSVMIVLVWLMAGQGAVQQTRASDLPVMAAYAPGPNAGALGLMSSQSSMRPR